MNGGARTEMEKLKEEIVNSQERRVKAEFTNLEARIKQLQDDIAAKKVEDRYVLRFLHLFCPSKSKANKKSFEIDDIHKLEQSIVEVPSESMFFSLTHSFILQL
ncbi:unnamed protein product [Microthlaspi erraticum]|uniref:Uncharacterized protein n=1 Tax=Microthlaspi erraticum TaxID=1685480 RepID=A0A6D2JF98_9BRAS|nr:unnamed protein product [Microthlaspi erraticum]